VLGTEYRLKLLMLRDHPELIDEYSEAMARWVLYTEIGARAKLKQFKEDPPIKPGLNSDHPAFAFEWSELLKSDPNLAKGAALDVYLRPDADWKFLEHAPGWDSRHPQAWVSMFLFPPSLEAEGKDVRFAAHDAAPILKTQLELAAKRESVNLWFPVEVHGVYDMNKQTLTITPGELGERSRSARSALSGQYQIYNLFKFRVSPSVEVQRLPGDVRQEFEELTRWRSFMGLKASVTEIATDQPLEVGSIPVNIKTAESLHLSNAKLKANIFVTAEKVQRLEGPKEQYALVAKVDKIEITTLDGTLIATLPASTLLKH
jgi:hypothetical protein